MGYQKMEDAIGRSGYKKLTWFLFTCFSVAVLYFLLSVNSERQSFLENNNNGNNNNVSNHISRPTSSTPREIFDAFYNCVQPKLASLRGNPPELFKQFVNLTQECDNLEEYKAMDIRHVENSDETKWVLYPKRDENITMVTLGIGKDIRGEETLRTLYPKTNFYGADPVTEVNKELYSTIGTYFPIAISATGGMQVTDVYRKRYHNEISMHIGIGYFFADMLHEKKIDILWIDNEGHEYSILDLLHNGAEMDQKGVKICQMNIEMHVGRLKNWNGEYEKFHDFVWKILEDGKYVMMKPFWVWKGFIRTFIANVHDEECTSMYIN